MKEPYGKGPASHSGPESCADSGNAGGEALTGETQAWQLSSEIRAPGSRPCCISGKAMSEACATGEHPPVPAESKTQSMCGHSSRGNRESPETSGSQRRPDRSGKVNDQAPDMHVSGQSHGGIVPANQPNRGGPYPPPEEAGEGRPPNQGEHGPSAADRTFSPGNHGSGFAACAGSRSTGQAVEVHGPAAPLEDKIVQQAVVTVLNQIYETDFKGFSYGSRPGRSPHQALDALWVGLTEKPVNWVLDADGCILVTAAR
jgi:hypothetical protein